MSASRGSPSQEPDPEVPGGFLEKAGTIIKSLGKTLLYSVIVIIAVTIASAAFGLITGKEFEISRLVIWNYVAGAILLLVGGIVWIGMSPHKKQGLDIASRIPMAGMAVETTLGRKKNPWIFIMGSICVIITGVVEVLTWGL